MTTPKMDLFLQLRGVTPEKLVEAMEDIKLHPEIKSVAVEIIGDFDGNLYTAQMDAIAPYLPGGAKEAVEKAYIGSAIPEWTSTTTSPYREGIKDWQEREKALGLQLSLWTQVKNRYPALIAHPNVGLYINYEAVMEWWIDTSIRWSYEYYFKRSIVDAEGIKRGVSIMWCPAFWYKTPPAGLRALVDQTWVGMKAHTGRIIDRIDVEDMMGRNWINATVHDVSQWLNVFRGTGAQVTVDCEMFEEPGWGPSDPAELASRMSQYAERGIEIGHCFEFRYWLMLPSFHTHGTTTPPPFPTVPAPTDEEWQVLVEAFREAGYEITRG